MSDLAPGPTGQLGFGALLRRLRIDACLPQEVLAERSGISAAAISKLERGTRKGPYRHTVSALADGLGLTDTARADFEATARRERARLLGDVEPGAQRMSGTILPLALSPLTDGQTGARRNYSNQAWHVPIAMRTPYFTGRERILETIAERLAANGRTALSGLGGVGKTQIALTFAIQQRHAYPNGVFWVDAETSGVVKAGYVEIAQALLLSNSASTDHELVVKATIEWLNRNDGWLLILDNVDDRREVAPFVPRIGAGHVLITSRESVFQEIGIARALELGDFEHAEAMGFLFKATGREISDATERAAAAELASELGNLPLALEQAAAYIAENNVTFSDYIASLRKRLVPILERAKELVVRDTVATVWSANFEAVKATSPGAAEVLRSSAFLAPDAIPFELLSNGADDIGEHVAEVLADLDDHLAVSELLRPLTRYSLVRSDAALRTYGLHRLVQEMIREAMAVPDRTRCVEALCRALDAAFPAVEYANWSACDRLVPHVAVLSKWIRAYDVHSESGGHVLHRAGWYLSARGRYVEAGPLLEQAVATIEQALGADHPQLAASLNTLGNLNRARGDFVDALPLFERALAIRERVLGPSHPDVVVSLDNLALLYGEQGRYAEAQPLLERSLAIAERSAGPDSLSVAWALMCLAWLCCEQGRFRYGRVCAERAVTIRERKLGGNHPEIVPCLNILAEIYLKEAKLAEAQTTAQRAVKLAEAALGPDHDVVASTVEILAKICCRREQYPEAIALAERVLAIRERALGGDHPHIMFCLSTLAEACRKKGDLERSQLLYERALTIGEDALSGHPEVDQIRRNVAEFRGAHVPTAPEGASPS